MTSSYCDAAHVVHLSGFPFPIKVRRAPAGQERRSSPELDCSAVPVPEQPSPVRGGDGVPRGG
jgi:hypothetical protein